MYVNNVYQIPPHLSFARPWANLKLTLGKLSNDIQDSKSPRVKQAIKTSRNTTL